MRQRVAIVTDSTASLPRSLAAQAGIEVVPMQLQINGVEDDESRIPPETLAQAMLDDLPVATAPPTVGAFFWTYQGLASRGVTSIVSVHMSGKLSQTVEAARSAAAQVQIPVRVLDSNTCGMSLGYTALAAAQAAERGGDVPAVLTAATQRSQESTELIYVDTLEYLRRGGRIGAAQKLLGDALSIKPLLTLNAGTITPLHKVRGAERARKRLVEVAAEMSRGRPVDIAIEHFAAEAEAQRLADRVRKRIPSTRELVFTEVSAIIGAHVGPGAVGITVTSAA